jgi:hypothetical protein
LCCNIEQHFAMKHKIIPTENTHGNIVNYMTIVFSFVAIQHFIMPRVCSRCNIEAI